MSSADPPPCPDPSVHDQGVSDSANKAAQMATAPSRPSTSSREVEALGPDGKLSAAGAATSLKYAKAKDLPSFPSVGIDSASGNKAASLATSNQKSIEMWKPDGTSSSASRAALLAARDGGKLDLWQYSPDGTGNSAASIAMGKNTSPQLDYGYTKEGHAKALLAATKSLSMRERPMSVETVSTDLYPDQANASFNALNAAAAAQRPISSLSGADAARIQNMQGVSRDMYGERPPVALEVEEKRHKEALRASAISMANQLYNLERADVERSITNPGSVAADRLAAQSYSAATTSAAGGDTLKMQAMNYAKVQEAAQKLAAERLAKLDPDGVVAYREHYGYGPSSMQKSSSKSFSRHSRGKSAELDDSDDEARAAKIKSQMSRFNDQVANVDAKKRTQDRENLMAAAARNVNARMHTMDEKVFAETGKVPPSMMEEWEAKARAKASADSEERMANHGKVHIGGGKFMDQSEVDAIAAARMQPTLDEINEEAERRRAHEAEVKADLERHRERVETEKQRDRDTKAELKRQQDLEKEKVRQEKAAEKAKAKEEKEAEKEKARAEKAERDAEKQKAKDEAKQLKEQQKQEKLKAEQERLEEERTRRAAQQKEAEERAAAEKAAAGEGEDAAAEKNVDTENKEESSSGGIGLLGFLRGKGHLDSDNPVAVGTTASADAATPAADATEETTREAPDTEEEVSASVVKDEPAVTEAAPVSPPEEPLVLSPEPVAPVEGETSKDAEGTGPSSPLQLTHDPVAAVAEPTPKEPTETEEPKETTVAEPTPKETVETEEPKETAASPRRDSRVKSFLGKFKRSSKAAPGQDEEKVESNVTEPATQSEETTTEPVLSEKAQGKQPAGVSPVSSEHEEGEGGETQETEAPTDASTQDVFEEARDKFDSDSGTPRASYAEEAAGETTTKTGSKFQEDL